MAIPSYTVLTDAELTSGERAKATQARALRDNFLAVIGADNTDASPVPSPIFFSSLRFSPLLTYIPSGATATTSYSGTTTIPHYIEADTVTFGAGTFTPEVQSNGVFTGTIIVRAKTSITISGSAIFNFRSSDVFNFSTAGADHSPYIGGSGGNGLDSGSSATLPQGLSQNESISYSTGDFFQVAGGEDGGGTSTGSIGGKGGGIIIFVAPTITFSAGATLNCSGENGVAAGGTRTGGGGGGVILLSGQTITGDGSATFNVAGGTPYDGFATAGTAGIKVKLDLDSGTLTNL